MITLQHSPGDVGRASSPRGSWWRARGNTGTRVEAVSVKCPDCGNCSTLRQTDAEGAHRGHDIAADGTVMPSLVCPHAPCTWHVFARLDGWAEA